MSDFLLRFAHNTWDLVAEMAPYLLFGFAIAGLLHLLIRREVIQRMLGKPGIAGVIKASLLGVPMPLCSCSVIPVAASLRQHGASRGATASFLSSTPQTGVDSILATYALMGGLFTAVRVAVAFVCGMVSGFLVDLCTKGAKDAPKQTPEPGTKTPEPALKPGNLSLAPAQGGNLSGFSLAPTAPAAKKSCCCESEGEPEKKSSCCQEETAAEASCCCSHESNDGEKRSFAQAMRYGLITLPADLANALIIGLVLAGLIGTLLPDDLFQGALSGGVLAFLIATAISLPLYVCATASIPMAYALMAAGLSPGAALVFLIVGPATNTATIVAVWKMLGQKGTVIYVASLVVVSWTAGFLFNAALNQELASAQAHQHEALHPALWQHLSGIGLVALLLLARWTSRRKKSRKGQAQASEGKSCCHA
ncbi:SO_0444 family Cu/Zn efflux transporter [Coraliomargarita parva]|uniref:SO_0444 family Cu/Zn efflux transporter n=1 Tax=Coraliomargarita parva TaxID=3014050 RepID=UPI0022B53C18|nr:SO_0444 family Cu/Zn efflux transporter [Coraliomargarita parva]